MTAFSQVKPAAMKLRVIPKFPSKVIAGPGIAIDKSFGTYTLSVNYDNLNKVTHVPGDDLSNIYAAGWDDLNKVFELFSITELKGLKGDPGDPGPPLPTGGTTAQVLAKASDSDDDVEWVDAGTGDMSASTYDPSGVGANAFDSNNSSFLQAGTGAVTRTSRSKMRDTLNVRDFGCVGDAVNITAATSINSGSAALTVSGDVFKSGDVGKTIVVPGAGGAGGRLTTTISAFTNSSQVTLATPASTTLSAVSANVLYYNDETSFLQAIINYAVANRRGRIILPAGRYATSGLSIASAGVTIEGEDRYSTELVSTSASATLLDMSGWYNSVSRLRFTAGVARSSGIFVDIGGSLCQLDNFWTTGAFTSFRLAGVLSEVLNGKIELPAPNGICGIVDGGDTSQLISNLSIQGLGAAAGIKVVDSSALRMTDVTCVQAGQSLWIAPGNGQNVYGLYAQNSFFDTAASGIFIEPTGTGNVARCRFTGCWASSHTSSGIVIRNSGTGVLSGLTFIDAQAMLNASGGGISMLGGAMSDIKIIGGEFAANAHGIYMDNSAIVSGLVVNGAASGACAGEAGNSGWGVVIGTGAVSYVMTGNNFSGNTFGDVTGHTAATNKIVANNLS